MMKHKNKLISVSLATIMLVAMVAVVGLSASAAPTNTVKVPVGSAIATWPAAVVGAAVVSGTASDGTVYCTASGSGAAPAWTSIGKPFGVTIVGDPAATIDGAGNVYIFVKGSDNCMYYSVQLVAGPYAVNAWTKVGTLTVATGTNPAAYTVGGAVNVLYVDPTTNSLKNVALATGTATDIGGYISASPSAAVTGTVVDVYVRGQSGGLWTAERATGGWTGWSQVPGNGYLAPGTGPSAVSGGVATGSIDVFVEGGSGGLWYQHYDTLSGQWNTGTVTGWRLVGGAITGTPGAVCVAVSAIGVMVKGADNNPWFIGTAGPYVGPPVPPVVDTPGWPWIAWRGPQVNVP